MITRLRALRLKVCLAVWLGVGSLALAENFTVEQFKEKLKEWPQGKNPPADSHRVEGRIQGFDKQLLRLKECDISFVGKAASKLTKSVQNVEVRGTVVRNPDTFKLEFLIESLSPMPSDAETFASRKKGLKGESAKKWHALADWAEGRGRFYNDSQLLGEASDARDAAFNIELKEIPADDPAAVFLLADRAKARGAGAGFIQSVDHQGCVARYQSLREAAPPELDEFLILARGRLSGCDQPTMAWDLPLRERYFKQPLETYRGASASKRSQMHRMLYAAVELRLLLSRLKPDDSNVIEVSDSIERLIPEEKAKAQELRDQALERRARDVEKLTRGELVALESDYRLRGQADQGRQLVETWLAMRRKKLDDLDVDGALDLANEYRTLLARPELGAQLLMEVWKRVPGSALLEERMQSLGYRLHEGRWLTQKEFENRPESRFEKAIRSGRVENGMNQDQARRALGVPHRISRIATAKVFTEHWAYDLADGSRMSVRLERKRGQPELVVTGAPPMNGL